MLNNFSSKCIKMTKRCAFGTSYSITYFNSGIKVRPSLGKACTNLCHVFGFVISTPGQGQQLLAGLFKRMVRRSTSSKGVNSDLVQSIVYCCASITDLWSCAAVTISLIPVSVFFGNLLGVTPVDRQPANGIRSEMKWKTIEILLWLIRQLWSCWESRRESRLCALKT